jgi:hypothetical protein
MTKCWRNAGEGNNLKKETGRIKQFISSVFDFVGCFFFSLFSSLDVVVVVVVSLVPFRMLDGHWSAGNPGGRVEENVTDNNRQQQPNPPRAGRVVVVGFLRIPASGILGGGIVQRHPQASTTMS